MVDGFMDATMRQVIVCHIKHNLIVAFVEWEGKGVGGSFPL